MRIGRTDSLNDILLCLTTGDTATMDPLANGSVLSRESK
jgi:hypothetical protein